MAKENTFDTNHVLAFIIGAAVGVGAGLMVAPSSGKQLRSDIGDRAKQTKNDLGDKIDSGKDAVKTKISDAIETIKAVGSDK